MVPFLLLLILAFMVAGPAGIAGVFGFYATVVLFLWLRAAYANVKFRKREELYRAAMEMSQK